MHLETSQLVLLHRLGQATGQVVQVLGRLLRPPRAVVQLMSDHFGRPVPPGVWLAFLDQFFVDD
jgi:hypothetical protein